MYRAIRPFAICLLLLVVLASFAAPSFASNAPPALTWVFTSPLPTPRYNAGIAVSVDNRIFVIGGDNYTCVPLNTVEEYTPARDTWSTCAALPTGRWQLGATAGADGLIYAIGGQGHEPCGADPLGTVEAYNPRANTWTTRSAMPTPRYGLGVVAGGNGKIYALGGQDRSAVLAVVEEYDPFSDTWIRKADMPVANRYFASVSASNGKIYVIGGMGPTDRVWQFDPVADRWTEKAPMPTARDVFGAAQARNGSIYAIGGFAAGAHLRTVEVYDPTTDRWSTDTSLVVARASHGVASVSNFVLAIGGWGVQPNNMSGPLGVVEAAKAPNR